MSYMREAQLLISMRVTVPQDAHCIKGAHILQRGCRRVQERHERIERLNCSICDKYSLYVSLPSE